MKKYLLWLPVFVIVMGATIYKPAKEALTEKPVDKSISFAVYKGNTYASLIYRSTSARLHISIEKISGSKRTIVWEKSFDSKLLNQYPSPKQPISQTVTIPKLFGKERIEIIYTLTYNADGSELHMQNGTVLPGSATGDKLFISI